ncbi:MAG: nitroreductase family protein, partial [Pseudomonadota bacterium]
MIKKSIDVSTPILPLLEQRYSGVSFDSTRPVAHQTLLTLAEAARWAPSCFGDEPWRFIICSKQDNPDAWNKALECLVEKNRAWCQHAPVLIITCASLLFDHNGTPNSFGPYDTGAAAMSMCLQATALGLMTHQMAGFVADKARELFAIPETVKPLAMMAVGYQLPEASLLEEFKTRELSPRKRKPLAEHFFGGTWGVG